MMRTKLGLVHPNVLLPMRKELRGLEKGYLLRLELEGVEPALEMCCWCEELSKFRLENVRRSLSYFSL